MELARYVLFILELDIFGLQGGVCLGQDVVLLLSFGQEHLEVFNALILSLSVGSLRRTVLCSPTLSQEIHVSTGNARDCSLNMLGQHTDSTDGGAFLYLFSRFRFAAGFDVESRVSDRQDSSDESSAPGYGTWKARSY